MEVLHVISYHAAHLHNRRVKAVMADFSPQILCCLLEQIAKLVALQVTRQRRE